MEQDEPAGDDAELVARLRDGDEEAFRELLDRYDAPLRRVARTYVATDTAADEVVQDTWLGVLRGIDRFEQRSSLKTWIFRILMNIARTRGTRDKRSVPFSSLGPEDQDDGPTIAADRFQGPDGRYPGHWSAFPTRWHDHPEVRALGHETLGVVRDALDMLPPAQQEVVRLRDLEGWTSTEVCNALGLTETNQRVLLHRGRAKLRTALERYFDEAKSVSPTMSEIPDIDCVELVELVTEYLDATLTDADRIRFEHHVGECPGCVEILEQFRVVVTTTGALRPDDAATVPAATREQLVGLFRDWRVTRR